MIVEGGRVSYIALPSNGMLVVGRGSGADIVIKDQRASREHARLHVGERLEVEDLRSVNGTLLRNQPLTPWERVGFAIGECIGIGGAVLVVQRQDLAGPSVSSEVVPVRQRSLESILPPGAIVEDERMKRVYELAARVAPGEVNVLILGESGCGKELLAETIHRCSARADAQFLSINCAALSEQLLESELFGHERGAFTGAHQAKPGLLESAPGGTVFLDEVGEMVPALQAKLLRVLETRQVLRVGSSKPRPIDVRFVSATNRVLADEVVRGSFRKDLYFRLNAISIEIPSLRERRGEILPLAKRFVSELFAEAGHSVPPAVSAEAAAELEAHDWPGNVRELKNAIRRALLLCDSYISAADLNLVRFSTVPEQRRPVTEQCGRELVRDEIAYLERTRIVEALDRFTGNQTRAAEHLGMSRRTFLNRLDEYRIARPRKRR
ncbi:MAG: sigma 54-interacting transcriptional regulator [Myxococcota bacterium]